MLTLNVPPGLGDISWLWSKLCHLDRPITMKVVENNQYNRASGFLDILPGVLNGGYKDSSYHREFVMAKKGLSPRTDIEKLADGEYYLSANIWLDSGNRIEGFLPDLPTNFHYSMNVTDEHKARVDAMLEAVGKKTIVTIYTSKYNTPASGWNLYEPNEWVDLCCGVKDRIGECAFVFVGAKFDGILGPLAARKAGLFVQAIDLTGQTEVGELVEILRRSAYCFAFPSGVGILCDVVDTPAMMFMVPEKHDLLKDTYADPENIASGRHLNVTYCPVEAALALFEKKGLKHVEAWV